LIVPFDSPGDPVEPPRVIQEGNRVRLEDPRAHEKMASRVSKERAGAAKKAEKEVAAEIESALGAFGKVVDIVVEEVRDR
jgi:hypothetical protein